MTVTATWLDELGALAPVTLDELTSRAELLARTDRKYVVTPEALARVIAAQSDVLRALEMGGARSSAYRSVYYDTPDWDSFLGAARGRPHRFKVRRRDYLDTGQSLVEVKLRSPRGGTVKHRRALPEGSEVSRFLALEEFAASFPSVASCAPFLRPTLVTSYRRSTLLCGHSRVTIDADVKASDESGREVSYGEALIVETKSPGSAGAFDRALWDAGFRPVRLSKYATSVAALHPDLPGNRWNRALVRHARREPDLSLGGPSAWW